MSSLSWLFGKKKTDAPTATVLPKTFEEEEGFQVVHQPSSFLYPVLEGGDASSLPYDVSAFKPQSEENRPPLLPSDSLPHHPLQDIPFKLNSQLDFDGTDLDVFLFEVKTALRNAVHVNTNVIKYNFSTERSVVNEEKYTNSNFS